MFSIYCHQDAKCTLKVAGNDEVLVFDDVLEAIRAARELSKGGANPLTVYSTIGTVIFEILI